MHTPARPDGIRRGRVQLTATQAAELARTTEPAWLALVRDGRAPQPDSRLGPGQPYPQWWYRSTVDVWTTRQLLQAQPAGAHEQATRHLLDQITDLAEAISQGAAAGQELPLGQIAGIVEALVESGELTTWTRTLLAHAGKTPPRYPADHPRQES